MLAANGRFAGAAAAAGVAASSCCPAVSAAAAAAAAADGVLELLDELHCAEDSTSKAATGTALALQQRTKSSCLDMKQWHHVCQTIHGQ
jgi:hypothetical protein